MENTFIMKNFIRFLKENNCYKKFFKYFYSQKFRDWRIKLNYNGNYDSFEEWVESLQKNSTNSINYIFETDAANNIYALIFMCSFSWLKTNEGIWFWRDMKNSVKEIKN